LSGVAYVVFCVTAIAIPARVDTVSKLVFPFYFGELIVILWLAFIGAKPPRGGGVNGNTIRPIECRSRASAFD
jgi:hypothetical protein